METNATLINNIMKGTWYYTGKLDTRSCADATDTHKVDGESHICDICGRRHTVLHVFKQINGTKEVVCGGGCATAAKSKARSKSAYWRAVNDSRFTFINSF